MTEQELPSRPKRRRTRTADLDLRRAEIVEAATRIFAREGYQGSAFATVAAAVGMTLPGLLRYFPRKVDLMLAVLEERDRQDAAFFADSGKNWRGFLAGLRLLAAHNEGRHQIVQAFSILNAESLAPSHPGHRFFRMRAERLQLYLAGLLREGQMAGDIRQDADPDQIATQIFAFMDGLQIWWLRMPEAVSMRDSFNAFLDRLEREIVVPSRSSTPP